MTGEFLEHLKERWKANEPEDVTFVWQFVDALIDECLEHRSEKANVTDKCSGLEKVLANIDRMAKGVLGDSSYGQVPEVDLKVAAMVSSIHAYRHNAEVDRKEIGELKRRVAELEETLTDHGIYTATLTIAPEDRAKLDEFLAALPTEPEDDGGDCLVCQNSGQVFFDGRMIECPCVKHRAANPYR